MAKPPAPSERRRLAQLLSAAESRRSGDDGELVEALRSEGGGHAWTLGITGPPGAGKSTLVDRLISSFRAQGDLVAVLAVDPSSPISGGAILGDRIRMNDHVLDPGVFIRSVASRGAGGGISATVEDSVALLDAAGFDWILVETVGVGQVEMDIAGVADTTLVVLTPGWGDHVQANKAGLMEIADVFSINKADMPGAKVVVDDIHEATSASALRAVPPTIVSTQATDGTGVAELFDAIAAHREAATETPEARFIRRRRGRLVRDAKRLLDEAISAARDSEAGEKLLSQPGDERVLSAELANLAAALVKPRP